MKSRVTLLVGIGNPRFLHSFDVTLGNLGDPNTGLAIFGILAVVSFQAWGLRYAILAGIGATTLVGTALGLVHWLPRSYSWADMTGTMLHLNSRGALGLGLLEIVFVFLIVDCSTTSGL